MPIFHTGATRGPLQSSLVGLSIPRPSTSQSPIWAMVPLFMEPSFAYEIFSKERHRVLSSLIKNFIFFSIDQKWSWTRIRSTMTWTFLTKLRRKTHTTIFTQKHKQKFVSIVPWWQTCRTTIWWSQSLKSTQKACLFHSWNEAPKDTRWECFPPNGWSYLRLHSNGVFSENNRTKA